MCMHLSALWPLHELWPVFPVRPLDILSSLCPAAGGLHAPNGLGSRPAPSSWQAAQQLQQEPAPWRPGQDLPARSDAQGLPRGVRLPWRRGPNHVYIACMIEQLQVLHSRLEGAAIISWVLARPCGCLPPVLQTGRQLLVSTPAGGSA